MKTRLTLACLVLIAAPGAAQLVVPEPEFTGTDVEDFEGFPLGAEGEHFAGILGGEHMVASPSPVNHVFGFGSINVTWVATNSISQCTISDPGDFQYLFQLAPNTLFGDELDFVFSSPVDRFGTEIADFGYFNTGATFEAEFYDEDLNLIHFEQNVNPSPCDWNWHGWRATGPKISRVRIRSVQTTQYPVYLMYDNADVDCASCFARPFCTPYSNSSGEMAAMWVTGSPSVSQNDLVLRAGKVPANKSGIFFFGPAQISTPFGNGLKCVGGGTKRLPLTTAQGEVLRHDMDFTTGSAAKITPGSTWHLQAWFRDPAAGGASTNLSTALSIDFQP